MITGYPAAGAGVAGMKAWNAIVLFDAGRVTLPAAVGTFEMYCWALRKFGDW